MLGTHIITAGRPELRDFSKAEDCHRINKKLSSESFFGGKPFKGGLSSVLNSELTNDGLFDGHIPTAGIIDTSERHDRI